VAWPTAAYFQPDDPVLDVVADLLQARLRRRLVDTARIAGEVRAVQDPHALGSAFVVTVTLAAGPGPPEARRAVDEELAWLRATDLTPAEASRAEVSMSADYAQALDTPSGRAKRIASLLVHGRDPGDMLGYLARVHAVTPAVLRAAVNADLPPD